MEKKLPVFRLEESKIYLTDEASDMTIKEPRDTEYFKGLEVKEDLYESNFDITAVQRVECPDLGQDVILKKIFKENLISKRQLHQARIEFALQSALKHPNIVQCFDYGECEDVVYGTLEACNKPTYLTETIDEDLMQIESEIQLKAFMADILEGMDYFHSLGIIHFDIKLENILAHFDEGSILPTLKICDFGLAHVLDEKGKVFIKEKLGTMHYIAPEVKKNTEITQKVDIWSLGICLYKMSCAYRPNQVKNYTYGSGDIPFRRIDWKKRSPELIDLVKSMLQYKPEDRITVKEALDHPWFHVDGEII